MSAKVDTKYLSESDLTRVLFYFFEESKVENIDKATLHIKAPKNESGEPLGKDVDIEVNFNEEVKK